MEAPAAVYIRDPFPLPPLNTHKLPKSIFGQKQLLTFSDKDTKFTTAILVYL